MSRGTVAEVSARNIRLGPGRNAGGIRVVPRNIRLPRVITVETSGHMDRDPIPSLLDSVSGTGVLRTTGTLGPGRSRPTRWSNITFWSPGKVYGHNEDGPLSL